ncbi:MAG: hypothetical protein QF704_01280, partial [Anaerolineales bacterium]|nr:hypothetical protein [Anaerolineales bacterium]
VGLRAPMEFATDFFHESVENLDETYINEKLRKLKDQALDKTNEQWTEILDADAQKSINEWKQAVEKLKLRTVKQHIARDILLAVADRDPDGVVTGIERWKEAPEGRLYDLTLAPARTAIYGMLNEVAKLSSRLAEDILGQMQEGTADIERIIYDNPELVKISRKTIYDKTGERFIPVYRASHAVEEYDEVADVWRPYSDIGEAERQPGGFTDIQSTSLSIEGSSEYLKTKPNYGFSIFAYRQPGLKYSEAFLHKNNATIGPNGKPIRNADQIEIRRYDVPLERVLLDMEMLGTTAIEQLGPKRKNIKFKDAYGEQHQVEIATVKHNVDREQEVIVDLAYIKPTERIAFDANQFHRSEMDVARAMIDFPDMSAEEMWQFQKFEHGEYWDINEDTWQPDGNLPKLRRTMDSFKALLAPGKETQFDYPAGQTDTLNQILLPNAMPAWESKVLSVVENNPNDRQSAEQWLGYIQNKTGKDFKEIDYLDLRQFLKGKSAISRQELADYIRANQLRIFEVENMSPYGDVPFEEQSQRAVDSAASAYTYDALVWVPLMTYWDGHDINRVQQTSFTPDTINREISNAEQANAEFRHQKVVEWLDSIILEGGDNPMTLKDVLELDPAIDFSEGQLGKANDMLIPLLAGTHEVGGTYSVIVSNKPGSEGTEAIQYHLPGRKNWNFEFESLYGHTQDFSEVDWNGYYAVNDGTSYEFKRKIADLYSELWNNEEAIFDYHVNTTELTDRFISAFTDYAQVTHYFELKMKELFEGQFDTSDIVGEPVQGVEHSDTQMEPGNKNKLFELVVAQKDAAYYKGQEVSEAKLVRYLSGDTAQPRGHFGDTRETLLDDAPIAAWVRGSFRNAPFEQAPEAEKGLASKTDVNRIAAIEAGVRQVVVGLAVTYTNNNSRVQTLEGTPLELHSQEKQISAFDWATNRHNNIIVDTNTFNERYYTRDGRNNMFDGFNQSGHKNVLGVEIIRPYLGSWAHNSNMWDKLAGDRKYPKDWRTVSDNIKTDFIPDENIKSNIPVDLLDKHGIAHKNGHILDSWNRDQVISDLASGRGMGPRKTNSVVIGNRLLDMMDLYKNDTWISENGHLGIERNFGSFYRLDSPGTEGSVAIFPGYKNTTLYTSRKEAQAALEVVSTESWRTWEIVEVPIKLKLFIDPHNISKVHDNGNVEYNFEYMAASHKIRSGRPVESGAERGSTYEVVEATVLYEGTQGNYAMGVMPWHEYRQNFVHQVFGGENWVQMDLATQAINHILRQYAYLEGAKSGKVSPDEFLNDYDKSARSSKHKNANHKLVEDILLPSWTSITIRPDYYNDAINSVYDARVGEGEKRISNQLVYNKTAYGAFESIDNTKDRSDNNVDAFMWGHNNRVAIDGKAEQVIHVPSYYGHNKLFGTHDAHPTREDMNNWLQQHTTDIGFGPHENQSLIKVLEQELRSAEVELFNTRKIYDPARPREQQIHLEESQSDWQQKTQVIRKHLLENIAEKLPTKTTKQAQEYLMPDFPVYHPRKWDNVVHQMTLKELIDTPGWQETLNLNEPLKDAVRNMDFEGLKMPRMDVEMKGTMFWSASKFAKLNDLEKLAMLAYLNVTKVATLLDDPAFYVWNAESSEILNNEFQTLREAIADEATDVVDLNAIVNVTLDQNNVPITWDYQHKEYPSLARMAEHGFFDFASRLAPSVSLDLIKMESHMALAAEGELARKRGWVPPHPWGAKTGAKMMERFIRWVAEKHPDVKRVTWTQGKRIAEQNNVTRAIDGIRYLKHPDNGKYYLQLSLIDHSQGSGGYTADINTLPFHLRNGITIEQMSALLPAEIVTKIIKEEGESYAPNPLRYDSDQHWFDNIPDYEFGGEFEPFTVKQLDIDELTVTGRGMINHYDRTLVQAAQKVSKQAGLTKDNVRKGPVYSDQTDDPERFNWTMDIVPAMKGTTTTHQYLNPAHNELVNALEQRKESVRRAVGDKVDHMAVVKAVERMNDAALIENGFSRTVKGVEQGFIDHNTRLFGDNKNADALRVIAESMYNDLLWSIGVDQERGKDFYDRAYDEALQEFSRIIPELKDNGPAGQRARATITLLLAITSDGTSPANQMFPTHQLYTAFKGNDKINNDLPDYGFIGSQQKNLDLVQEIYEELDGSIELLTYFLLEKVVVSNETRYDKQQPKFLVGTVVPRAALILGPKLGMFYANLSGHQQHATLDRWAMRTYNRARGEVAPKVSKASLETFRELHNSRASDGVILQQVEDAGKEGGLWYNYSNRKQSPRFLANHPNTKDRGMVTELENLVGYRQSSTKYGRGRPSAKSKEKFRKDGLKAFLAADRRRTATGKQWRLLYQRHLKELNMKNLYNQAYIKSLDAPRSPAERNNVLESYRAVQQLLKDNGHGDYTIAQIQAL